MVWVREKRHTSNRDAARRCIDLLAQERMELRTALAHLHRVEAKKGRRATPPNSSALRRRMDRVVLVPRLDLSERVRVRVPLLPLPNLARARHVNANRDVQVARRERERRRERLADPLDMARLADRPHPHESPAPALAALHVAEHPQERRERERDARAARDEHDGVVVVEVGGEAVGPVDEHFDFVVDARARGEPPREALAHVDQERELFPVGRDVVRWARRVHGHRNVVALLLRPGGGGGGGGSSGDSGELVVAVDGRDGERVRLEGVARDSGHGEECGLARGPAEVRRALDV